MNLLRNTKKDLLTKVPVVPQFETTRTALEPLATGVVPLSLSSRIKTE